MIKRTTSRRMKMVGVVAAIFLILPAVAFAGQRFDDVDDDNIFAADIGWLADAGVTRGCNPPANTDFCPEGNVTRQQMAAFLHRLANNRVVDAGTLEGFSAADLMGSAGPSGPAGADGAQGPAGPAGAGGAQGPQGPAGADGADGAHGVRLVLVALRVPRVRLVLMVLMVRVCGADGAQGPAGADGAQGPAFTPVVTQRSVAFVVPSGSPSTATATESVSCQAGESVVGGGVAMSGPSTVWADGPTASGWTASVSRSPFTPAGGLSGTVYAICANFNPSP